jgi:hypothetical protein
MNELNEKEMFSNSQLVKEEAEKMFAETDMIQFEVENVSKNKQLMGKTIQEWVDHFSVPVARQSDPVQVSQYCAQIIVLLHDAYAAKGKLEASLVAFKMGYMNQRDEEFLRHALNRSRKTIPKKESLDAIADAKMGSINLALLRYEKGIAFFQSMVYKLNTTLEAVKTIAMSNGTLRKAELGAY